MIELSGKTRVYFIVGDPIAQVKSPAGMTAGFERRGRDAVVIPAHVSPARYADFVAGARAMQNVDGIIATVPHKFRTFEACDEASDRARFLGAANVVRRRPDGRWFGDMVDGAGFVQALLHTGFEPVGRRALLVGAGGAGSAIAHALLQAGVTRLGVCDEDAQRRQSLIERLGALGTAEVSTAGNDPAGCDLVVNATPVGMREGDPLPVRIESLSGDMAVGDAITAPAVTPLIAAARIAGCRTVTGLDMFASVAEHMLDFFMNDD